MKKRAKEFKEGYNNWITNGLEMPIIPVASQSTILEKSKQEFTDELKRKDETTRMEKHHKMAVCGSQFMHEYESNWFWDIWNIETIKERWSKRDKNNHPPKRALIREFMEEYPVFQSIVYRLQERKIRSKSNAQLHHVLDTIISSHKSFNSNSRI